MVFKAASMLASELFLTRSWRLAPDLTKQSEPTAPSRSIRLTFYPS